MSEIPEHLLKRSAGRRAALSGAPTPTDSDGASSSSQPVPAQSNAAAAAPTPKAKTEKPVAKVKPVAPHIKAAQTRSRIPFWAMPALAALPIWALLYVQTLSKPASKAPTQLEAGAAVFTSKGCSGCHGSTGGGGTGRQLSDGEVIKTFPDISQQFEFVKLGTAGFQGVPYGDPNRDGGAHIGGTFNGAVMPSFASGLTETELIEVVRYIRETLSGEKPEENGFKIGAAGELEYENGTPVLSADGKLVDKDGKALFGADNHLANATPAG